MFSVIFIVSIIIDCCFGGILDCDTQFGQSPGGYGAIWCADEGGSCNGPGRVYYGEHLTWTYKDLTAHQSISCSNDAFGCDPLVAFTKRCYS